MKKLVGIAILTMFVSIPGTAFGQTDVERFYSKGTVTGEHFTGGVMWTALDGEKATVISQWDLGRSKIHATISPTVDCEENYKICVEAIVTDTDNSAAAKPGDKFIIKIDPENSKQVLVGKAGFLENVEIIIDITKIYGKTVPHEKPISVTDDDMKSIMEAAYIYGYPLVLMDLTMKQMTNVPNPEEFAAPVNQFAHVTEYPDPDFKAVVSPNADTLYSVSFLDLSVEPLVLHVPDTKDRYYLMPMLDAWTNVFASPGKRTTGTGANDFVITGPFWEGVIPDGTTEIKSPTNLVWIIGRTQTNGKADYDAVHKIQEQYTLTPLSSFGKPYQPPADLPVDPTIDMTTPPVTQITNMGGSEFFSRLAVLMEDNPPAPADAEVVKRFEKIGLYPGKPFDTSKMSQQAMEILDNTPKAAQPKILENFKNLGSVVNGWTMVMKIGSYDVRYMDRATIALIGLGANIPEDAVYPATTVDGNGDNLNGANKYVMHFSQPPPVGAFWSITMYGKDTFFVKNPIERYAIGDRDNIKYNEDGSLDIYIQHETPEGNESNWLPAPADNFQMIMRLYWPEEDVLNGTWQPPIVEKTE